jgi:hypothetical protein
MKTKNNKTITMTIKLGKPSIGHQATTHQVHDHRLKRKRTRQTQRTNYLKGW